MISEPINVTDLAFQKAVWIPRYQLLWILGSMVRAPAAW